MADCPGSNRHVIWGLISGLFLWTLPSIAIAQTPPAADSKNLAIWPNSASRANSDAWLIEHHDLIREMRPRVLVLNFSNQAPREHLDSMFKDIVAALSEGSRYHGYRDSRVPSFLNYQLFKFVDLRDESTSAANSGQLPYKPPAAGGFNIDYNRFFSDEFARYYGVRDPSNSARFLRLNELVDQGFVHELWFFVEHTQDFRAYEVV